MASLNDSANIFTGDALDAFNAMEAALVAAGGDVSGAQARLIPVMLAIVEDKQSSSGVPGDLTAETDTTRSEGS